MLALHDAGLCVLPADPSTKFTTLSTWKKFQSERPSRDAVGEWEAYAKGWCVIGGRVSGTDGTGLEVIDFDFEAELFAAWADVVESEAPGLVARLVIERSQSGGKHVFYRSTAIPGNTKLASRAFLAQSEAEFVYRGKTLRPRKVGDNWIATACLIETRGQGGLLVCSPTPGYSLEQGELTDIPTISRRERDILIEAAKALNEIAPEPTYTPGESGSDGDSPGDDYNRRGDVRELLRRHGWTSAGGEPNERWRRPGKSSGCSATLREIDGIPRFYVFSSNAEPFEENKGYTPFGVAGLLEANGDWRKAASMLRAAGYGQQSVPTVLPDDDDDDDDVIADTREADIAMERGLSCPGLVDDVMQFILETQHTPQRTTAFAGALALLSHLVSRRVCGADGTRPNLFQIVLAPSGWGKERPRAVVRQILEEIGAGNTVHSTLVSAAGIEDALLSHPCGLWVQDEIDSLIGRMANARDTHAAEIEAAVKQAYSWASGTVSRRSRAKSRDDSREQEVIRHPHMSLMGSCVPGEFYSSVTPKMLADGFLSRMLILEAAEFGGCVTVEAAEAFHGREVPADVIARCREWWEYEPNDLWNYNPEIRVIPRTPEAAKEVNRLWREWEESFRRATALGDRLECASKVRVREQAGRLVLLHACSAATPRDEIMIGVDSVVWGFELATKISEKVAAMVGKHKTPTSQYLRDNADLNKAILEFLRKSGGTAKRRQFVRSVRCYTKEMIDKAEASLVDGQIIEVTKNGVTVSWSLTPFGMRNC